MVWACSASEPSASRGKRRPPHRHPRPSLALARAVRSRRAGAGAALQRWRSLLGLLGGLAPRRLRWWWCAFHRCAVFAFLPLRSLCCCCLWAARTRVASALACGGVSSGTKAAAAAKQVLSNTLPTLEHSGAHDSFGSRALDDPAEAERERELYLLPLPPSSPSHFLFILFCVSCVARVRVLCSCGRARAPCVPYANADHHRRSVLSSYIIVGRVGA